VLLSRKLNQREIGGESSMHREKIKCISNVGLQISCDEQYRDLSVVGAIVLTRISKL
jgi:hypothetical protein